MHLRCRTLFGLCAQDYFSRAGHELLDWLGFIFDPADVINFLWYTAEGNAAMAAATAVAIVPAAGSFIAKGTKQAIKAGKKAAQKAGEKAAKNATEKAAKKAAKKQLAKEAGKEAAEKGAEKAAKEAAEKATEKTAKETAEKTAKEAAEKGIKGGSEPQNVFPENPDDLLPEISRNKVTKANGTTSQTIQTSDNIRIRAEQHPLSPGEIYNPRHHGIHYHVEYKVDPTKSWNNKNNVKKWYPEGYVSGAGSGFIPGEVFPK